MLSFSEFLIVEMQSNENLSSMLDKHGGHYGSPDEKIKHLSPTVSLHSTEHGSYRFVKHDDTGKALAAIQVMSREKGHGLVANAYTHTDHRRQGYGTELIRYARKQFSKSLTFSDDQSDDGSSLVQSVK